MDFAEFLLRYIIDILLILLALRFLMRRDNISTQLQKGSGKMIALGDGVSIEVFLDDVTPKSMEFRCALCRGEGRWRDERRFTVDTSIGERFLIFPMPGFNWNHEFRVDGIRVEDTAAITVHKKNQPKIPFFGGPPSAPR